MLVPVLLLLFPSQSPSQLTTVSLLVVLANSVAGSISYWRLRRADYWTGGWLAAATIPGAVLGSIVVGSIPRLAFQVVMGAALVTVGAFLAIRPSGRFPLLVGAPLTVERDLVDGEGIRHRYRFNLGLAIALSVAVGFLSSLLGIGGGIVHVPALTTFFDFPEHVATATSHFVLVFTAGAGAATHLAHGDLGPNLGLTVALAAGVLGGAPAGAAISGRITGPWIIRLLAVALALVGLRLLIAA